MNDPGFISEHPRLRRARARAAFVLTKILTKTARLPTAIYDAHAPQVRGHSLLRNGLLRFPAVGVGVR